MGLILDSSEIIALERNRGAVDSLVAGREDEPFGISVVTVAELLHGVERADTEIRKIRRQAFVEKVIEAIPVVPFDSGVARIYARIWIAAGSAARVINQVAGYSIPQFDIGD
jgi:tRNA(fMet)-specific endonuclease VapC